jgi:hypothetical protein
VAYQVPETPRRPFAFFRAGWFPEEHEGQRRWRWMGQHGELALVNPTGRPAEVRLRLTAQSYAGQLQVALSLEGRPAGSWQVERGDTELIVRLLLPPGESSLLLSAPVTQEAGRSGRALSIVVVAASLR